MLHKSIRTLLLAFTLLFSLATVASAHATVSPKEMTANSYEKFILRVPNEKEIATVKVRVEIPAGFAASRVRPMPGWSYEVEKTDDGKSLKAITWSGSRIEAGEFQEFEFQGKTAEQPGKYAFRAYQTYEDGELVEWTGPSDAKTPASMVDVKASSGGTDAHGAEKPAETQPAPAEADEPAPAPTDATPSPLTAAAAYGGLLLGAAALLLNLRRR